MSHWFQIDAPVATLLESVTWTASKFDQKLESQCGSTCYCVSRTVPVIQCSSMLLGRQAVSHCEDTQSLGTHRYSCPSRPSPQLALYAFGICIWKKMCLYMRVCSLACVSVCVSMCVHTHKHTNPRARARVRACVRVCVWLCNLLFVFIHLLFCMIILPAE